LAASDKATGLKEKYGKEMTITQEKKTNVDNSQRLKTLRETELKITEDTIAEYKKTESKTSPSLETAKELAKDKLSLASIILKSNQENYD
jgi:hypothetical protein